MRARLVSLAILLLLPGIALSALLILRTYDTERDYAESALRDTASLIGLEVDRQFLQAELLLRTLAETGDLARGDLQSFGKLARSTAVLGGHLVLLRRDGRQMINTSVSEDADLADEPPPPFWDREVPGHAFVSNLVRRPDSGELAVQVVLPLAPRGAHELDLILVFPAAAMQNLLAQQVLPAGWAAAILDPLAAVVAVQHDPDLAVGAPLDAPTRAAVLGAPGGMRAGVLGQQPSVMAYTRSANTAWIVTTAAPRAQFAANARRGLVFIILFGLTLLGVGVLVAISAARSITQPIEALANAARHLGETDYLLPVPAGLAEADDVASAMRIAAGALRERRASMADLNATLAARVSERTAELADANQALEEQRAQLGLILDNMPFGVLVNRLDDTVAYANPEARRLLRVGDGPFDISTIPTMRRNGVVVPRSLSPGAVARSGTLIERQVIQAELRDGGTIDIEVTAAPVYDRNGQVALSVVAFHDVSAQLIAEESRRRAQRLEAVGQLTGGVAHEFNNLLMAITGCLDLLASSVPAGRATVLLESAGRAADRGARLTRQLLAFSRRQHLQTQSVDINALINGMTELLASTIGRGIAISTSLAQDGAIAVADPAQLELVLLNLAINARDAMPDGGQLIIGTANATLTQPRRAEDPPAGDYVDLSVRDNGTGMTADVLARVFEPFFTTKEIGRGTGLGLPQVLGVAQQLGGGVAIDSTPGNGTVVHIYLRPARSAAPAPAIARPAAPQPRALDGVRVLLVDDDADVREVARDILAAMGAAVTEADGGDAALAVLAAQKLDIVLADLTMPGMTGLELARHIDTQYAGLPMVLMTGYTAAAIDTVPPAVVATLFKPFRAVQLVATLTAALTRPATATDNPLPNPAEQGV